VNGTVSIGGSDNLAPRASPAGCTCSRCRNRRRRPGRAVGMY
jgi:hypothetical protein